MKHAGRLILGTLALGACSSAVAVGSYPARLMVGEPEPTNVEAVLFLVGDAGNASEGRSPVLAQLAAEVEYWSAELDRDSAVSVAYLGDIVYPDGVHDRGHRSFPRDSVRLWNQIQVVAGPSALAKASQGLFLTGNHDWGNMTGEAAVARALNLRAELDSARAATGAQVSLLPAVDHPGPVVRDIRGNIRLIFMDTHWWIQERSDEVKEAFFQRMEDAFVSSGDREVILLAHHPWASAGPHGVVASGSRSIGLLYLLSKSGVYAQDVNAPTHGDFRARLRATFERAGKVPLVYAAGHDHSLQVLEGRSSGDPRHILISGSGSKLSSVEDTVALRYAAVKPGYMTLMFRDDDSVDLFVHAGSAAHLSCPAADEARIQCMTAVADSFRTVFSDRIYTSSAN